MLRDAGFYEGKPLSPRQREVLLSFAEGMRAKEIAKHLSISHRTVEVHAQVATAKLAAFSITHAVAIAVRRGIIG